ncbi:ABZJ_00895 family protein [Rhizobium sp. G187]|uniref:ABZJ_00895 family protein n=1 Tax=Rhizobium sp. G187 TaxID=3451352 RepID=UPI003EE5E210
MRPVFPSLIWHYLLALFGCELIMMAVMEVASADRTIGLAMQVAAAMASAAYAGSHFAAERKRMPDGRESLAVSAVLVALGLVWNIGILSLIIATEMVSGGGIATLIEALGLTILSLVMVNTATALVAGAIVTLPAFRLGAGWMVRAKRRADRRAQPPASPPGL